MIKEKDFIELEYTGKIKDDNTIFDTTDEKTAKENNLFNENAEYKPVIICVGQGQIINGLDKALQGKEPKKEYTIEIKAEDAYGKKNVKLIQLISTSKFHKQNIQPMPGLPVDIDGMPGIIKTVSGGRTLVDFNHPLSGKDVVYNFKINRVIEDDSEKIKSILKINLEIKDADVKIENEKVKITTKQKIPKSIEEGLKSKIKELLPDTGDIDIIKSENSSSATKEGIEENKKI